MKMYSGYSVSEKKKFKIYIIILIIFSIFINQHFANRGVFPIDSFLIFDAANNIILGNHPFKDYWSITGPFLDYVQSLFFLVFGVNWFSYVFHASIINMLFSIFTFYFFYEIGLKKSYAFLYSLGVSILAYPSIGTPFIDHHAVILSVISIYCLSLGILTKKNIFWFLASAFLVLSFFSKQIPSVYQLILFTIILSFYFIYLKKFNQKNIIHLFLGVLSILFFIFCVFFINEIPLGNFLIQYIYYPYSIGEDRIELLSLDFKNLVAQFKFIYFALIPLVISTIILIKNKKKNKVNKQHLVISLLFLGSVAIFIYYQLITKNQVLIFFLIPISAAFSHFYAKKYLNKEYFIYFILIIFIFSTSKYHLRFNQNKKFMELIDADFNLAVKANQLDPRLNNLKWITPHYSKNPSHEINLLLDAKNVLLNTDERKMIITDYQFFSSLLKNKFASPNKWYDNRSIPDKENKYYNVHKKFFFNKIKKNKIENLFFIGQHKHKMYFFQELISENKCITVNQPNELLVKFDISKCKF